MTNPQDFTPRVEAIEGNIRELQRSISDLTSTVSTLANIVSIHEQQHQDSLRLHEESRQQADADRALMLQLIQSIAQGRNGGEGN